MKAELSGHNGAENELTVLRSIGSLLKKKLVKNSNLNEKIHPTKY